MIELALLALLWSAVAFWRVRILVRFFQLEEYMNLRFLRWAAERRAQWLPLSMFGAIAVVVIGGVLVVAGIETTVVLGAVALIAIAFAAYQPPASEIKKRFVATQRARRLLGAVIAIVLLVNMSGALLLGGLDMPLALVLANLVGLLVAMAAPLWLPVANITMYPVEASLRRGFVRKASRRLHEAAPIVIGITGSYGKTSTKHYLKHILDGRYRVLMTPKSYNTLMGVCLTINNDLDPTAGYQYFVVEMGAYVPGEIERICKLTRPAMSIAIAVGPQHLERFGSLDNIQKAKYEIIAGLQPDGTGLFNFDDPRVREMETRGHPNTRYGVSYNDPPHEDARLIATNIQHSLNGLQFDVLDRKTGEKRQFRTALVGIHNVTNILLATVAALETGMTLNEIALRVSTLEPAEHRLRRNRLPNGIMMLDDAYNTNPLGARNALQVLGLNTEGRRVLVTPGMVELADIQDEENRKLGEYATRYATDIVLVGKKQTLPLQAGVRSTDFDSARLIVVDTVQEAIEWYQRELSSGDAILFLNDLADNYL
jgi:UDP-N-acetylmuramoyl-tripeptide--D-alanyl-D-alanine ligase